MKKAFWMVLLIATVVSVGSSLVLTQPIQAGPSCSGCD